LTNVKAAWDASVAPIARTDFLRAICVSVRLTTRMKESSATFSAKVADHRIVVPASFHGFDDAPGCVVGQSLIRGAGRGLFANKNFLAGDTVVDYSIVDWQRVRFTDLSPKDLRSLHFVGLDTEYCLRTDQAIKFWLANHSSDPTCHWDRDRMRLVAMPDIQCGTEITFNYLLEVKPQWLEKPDWAYKPSDANSFSQSIAA
jgi:SET domain